MIKFERYDVIEYLLTVFQAIVAFITSFICTAYGAYLISDNLTYTTEWKEGFIYILMSLLLVGFNIVFIFCVVKVSSARTHILLKYELRAIHSLVYIIECSIAILMFLILEISSIIIDILVGAILISEIYLFNKNLDRLKSKLRLDKE